MQHVIEVRSHKEFYFNTVTRGKTLQNCQSKKFPFPVSETMNTNHFNFYDPLRLVRSVLISLGFLDAMQMVR